ncbi:hypothetical protein AMEX_G14190 [Astyanax mexicanus]|uniref:Uncharacterized protein n=1 Tax=Astyanax mexicanus TaxID=7994 RepID=A0A8T2LR66_ASTMX|nr:hypothetical protein AMEX_G14190 [Astyanax mexicanus]
MSNTHLSGFVSNQYDLDTVLESHNRATMTSFTVCLQKACWKIRISIFQAQKMQSKNSRKEIAVKRLQESEDLSDVCRLCGEATTQDSVDTATASKWIACD